MATHHDYTLSSYTFKDGTSLDNINLYYVTLGCARYDDQGNISNAILFLHGTGGSSDEMLTSNFFTYLYSPGKPMDITRYYIILPDAIGHGQSSRPSETSSEFPNYMYEDMVHLRYF